MTKIGKIDIVDKLDHLKPKLGPLTLKDFDNNNEMFEMYTTMMNISERLDSNHSELTNENSNKNEGKK
jgi:hypothetical protein